MKVRLPKGATSNNNFSQLAKQAQKIREEMDKTNAELEKKEYVAYSGGKAVAVTVLGSMEIKDIKISKDVVDDQDIEMLQDLIIAAVNEALKEAEKDKSETMDKISSKLQLPNMPGLF